MRTWHRGGRIGKVIILRLIILMPSLLTLSCGPTYHKENIESSVEKLISKELGAESHSQLVGRTLYVSLPIHGIMTDGLEISKNVIEQVENAMIALSRVALSSDADVQFIVIEALDVQWGVRMRILRKMQDLKDLFYWRISKPDFDERLVLNMDRAPELEVSSQTSTPSRAAKAKAPLKNLWHDISLQEYMGELIASRLNSGAQSNPILNLLLGIDKITPKLDLDTGELELIVSGAAMNESPSAISLNLLKSSIVEQTAMVEKKYLTRSANNENKIPLEERLKTFAWIRTISVLTQDGEEVLNLKAGDWRNAEPVSMLK